MNVSKRMGVASGYHVIAFFVFFNAVDMEPVPGIVGCSGLTNRIVAVVKGEVIRCTPFKEELVGFNVNFLKDTVEDEAVLGPAKCAEIPRY